MTGLSEAASGGSAVDVILPADLADEPRLKFVSFAIYSCDDLTAEGDFPEYGDSFFEVTRRSPSGDGWEEEEEQPTYALIPSQLAQMIEEEIEEVGGYESVEPWQVQFDVEFAGKSDGGRWQFMADVDVRDAED